jgi:DNA polymerase I
VSLYLPRPEDFHKYWYLDIETDSLTPTKVWVMCASNMASGDVLSFVGHDEIRRFFDELHQEDIYYVGHNFLSFDGPSLIRLCGVNIDLSRVVDTLVLSYLYDPHLGGGHSLEAWGDRLQYPKGVFSDWSKYSSTMDEYCQQDVRLGKRVFRALVNRMRTLGFSELSCQIEHEIRDVVNEQQTNGWYFDIPGAQALFGKLQEEQTKLEPAIRDLFPPQLVEVNRYDVKFKKDGSHTHHFIRHMEEYPDLRVNEDGTYSVYDWQEFNIGSPKQRLDRLVQLGYEPVNFTDKGAPKVDEESLIQFAETCGRDEVRAIAQWLVLQGRRAMVGGWLDNVNYADSCMHGVVFTCGAASRRMRHAKPNTANIPKAKPKVQYGRECRELWRARPGRKEVGYDASGLELRMFAHYLNQKAATDLILNGDPHLVNTRNLELPDHMRDITVKNGLYACLYGAGDPRLGKTIRPELSGDEATEYGKWARKRLEAGIPGFGDLVKSVKAEFKSSRGLIRTIDGGFVRCPSVAAALNYKLQSAGAIVMKVAAIILRKLIREKGLDSLLVGSIHDEGQHDVLPADAEELGKLAVLSIQLAGEQLNFNLPLTGEYKIGNNWAECH